MSACTNTSDSSDQRAGVDPMHRSPKELEAFIDVVERRSVRLAVVTGGDYVLTTRTGGCQRGT